MAGINQVEFDQIFMDWYNPLRNFVYYKSGDIQVAEDIVQDTFMKIWERRDTIKIETIKSLLYKIAGNLFLNRVEHEKVIFKFISEYEGNAFFNAPDFELEMKEFDSKLQGSLAELGDKNRIVFLMNRIDDLTYSQIADNLGLSVKAVEKRMGKAIAYFEPRFSVNYQLSDGLSVRMATGRYYQFINQMPAQQETAYNKNFWVLSDNTFHPAVTSNHFIFGMTSEKGRFLLDAEAYIKSYSRLQEYIYISQFLKNSDFPRIFPKKLVQPEPDPSKPSYFLTGTGRSYGIDLLLKYKSRTFTSWVSYSYGRSLHKFRNINYGEEIPAPTDQPHQLSWTNMLSTGRWNFGTFTLYSSGRSYIDFTRGNTTLPLLRIYKRLPDYLRSDFSVNYNFSIRKTKFKTGATFINIFNTENYFDINTRKFDFENTSFSETTLIQSQSFSINLFVHFVF